jgi:hypothetical protein
MDYNTSNMNHLTFSNNSSNLSAFQSSYWPQASHEELESLAPFKKKIGIIRLWPNQAAAEHESIERFRRAADILGVEIVELDRLGFLIDGPHRKVTENDVDFVISLHYETPKSYDCFSWAALWNPIDFYVEWGVSPYLDNQFSHDGYLMCGSAAVRRLAETELGNRFAASPKVDVNHTLSGPIYPPRLRTDRRVAYCGINWERLSNKPGRFGGVLGALDKRGVLDIYGPSEVRGITVWEGFAGYKHSAPFDGVSLIGDLAESGAVLAFSSPAHVRSAVMSNRLFEAAAAGALVFVDDNPFFDNHFEKEVIRLEMKGSGEDQATEVRKYLDYFNRNPEEALERCNLLQSKFLEKYSLHHQILDIYFAFGEWKQKQQVAATLIQGQLEFILLMLQDDQPFPGDLVGDIAEQDYTEVSLTIVKPGNAQADERLLNALPAANIKVVHPDMGKENARNNAGMIIADAIENSSADYFCVLLGNERIFKSFAREMVFAASKSDAGAACGILLRHYEPAEFAMTGVEHVDYMRPDSMNTNCFVTSGNVVLPRKTMRALSGAFQLLSWRALQKVLEVATRDNRATVDKPLISGDLKKFERFQWLDDQPYETSQATAVLKRYMQRATKNDIDIHVYRHTEAVSALAIASLSENERRLIIIELLKTLPIPPSVIRMTGWLLRRLMGIRRTAS